MSRTSVTFTNSHGRKIYVAYMRRDWNCLDLCGDRWDVLGWWILMHFPASTSHRRFLKLGLSRGQHPTEDAVLFSGTQDNGGVRFTGEKAWLYSSGGDAGYAVINWNDPCQVGVEHVRPWRDPHWSEVAPAAR